MRNLLEDHGVTALCKARHGYMLVNKHDFYIGRSILHYGEWSEEEVVLFMQLCDAGDTVIEVGSNIGTHAIPLAQKIGPSGHFYGFEPQRVVYQNLCANISINSLLNAECYLEAVGDTTGTVHIPDVDYNVSNNFGGIRVSTDGVGTAVPLVTLDDKFSQLPSLKFLKVDAEDMELHVIRGAAKLIARHRPYMYLENNPGSLNQVALVATVQAMGYSAYWHVTSLYNPNNFFGKAENVLGNAASFNILCVPTEKTFTHAEQFGLKLIREPTQGPF